MAHNIVVVAVTTWRIDMKHAKIETVDDERDIGNSLIVTLKRGWRFEDIGEHVRGYDTKREAIKEVRASKPCACDQCRHVA
jgi:hypothetical protein